MQENNKIWNVKNLLNWATEYFTSRDIPQPRLSAELLLSDVLEMTRMNLYLNFEKIPGDKERKKFRDYLIRRISREPVQYILGKSSFRNLELCIDRNVLIPRPETELLVDSTLHAAFELILQKSLNPVVKGPTGKGPTDKEPDKDSDKSPDKSPYIDPGKDPAGSHLPLNLNILEIGTGSGAIALSLITEIETFFKKQLSLCRSKGISVPAQIEEGNFSFRLFATDNSEDALKIAIKNAAGILSQQEMDKVKFLKADIIPAGNDFISRARENIDIVVSNPPYITLAGYAKLPSEVKDFEPENALLSGESGTEFYRKIINAVISQNLLSKKSARFIFETDPIVCSELVKILQEELKPGRVTIEKDYNGLDRVVIAELSSE